MSTSLRNKRNVLNIYGFASIGFNHPATGTDAGCGYIMINYSDLGVSTFFLSTVVAVGLCVNITGLMLYMNRLTNDMFIAYSYSVIAVLALYSALIQSLLMLGVIYLLPVFEVGALVFSVYSLVINAYQLKNYHNISRVDAYTYIPVVLILVIMLLHAVVLIPLSHDCLVYNVARTSLMLGENKLFVDNFNSVRQVMYNPGFDVLNILLTRFRSDYYLGFINFLLFLSIMTAIVSILKQQGVKSKYWILSISALFTMDSLVLQATSSKNDIVLIACEMTIFATIFSMQKSDNKYLKLSMVALCLVFGSISKMYFVFLLVPLALSVLGCWEYFSLKGYCASKTEKMLCKAIVALCLTHSLLFMVFLNNNYIRFHSILGDIDFVSQQKNHDGIMGMASNAMRYILTMPALTNPSYKEFVIHLHEKILGLGNYGSHLSFLDNYDMTLSHHEELVGVGWLFFLIFCFTPVLIVLVKNIFQRMLMLTAIILFLSVAYFLAWNPWWTRFFPFVFVPLAPFVSIVACRFNMKVFVVPLTIIFCLSAYFSFKENIVKNFDNILLAVSNREELYNKRNPFVFGNASLFKSLHGNVLILAGENEPIYQYYVLMKNASIDVLNYKDFDKAGCSGALRKYVDDHNISTVIDMVEMCDSLEHFKTQFKYNGGFEKVRILKKEYN